MASKTTKAASKRPTKAAATKATAASPRKVTARTPAKRARSVSSVAKKAGGRSALYAHQSRLVDEHWKALTAAAQILETPEQNKASESSPTKAWQHACTGYGRTIPELSAAKMWVGNAMSRIRLRVGKRNSDGSIDDAFDGGVPVEDVNPEMANLASEIVGTIRSPIGGQSEILRAYGEAMFMVGEGYLLPVDTVSGIAYKILSIDELKRTGGRWVEYQGPGLDQIPVPDGIEPMRFWRPDDIFSSLPTSSVRACMEILEELQILTRLVRSSAISRMALSGVLLMSDEWDPGNSDGEDDSEQEYPLIYDMILNGAKAIDDPASAASWMPYVLTGPTELVKDGLRLETFHGADAQMVVQRTEVIERLAQGLDVQKEVVLGHQDTTFANAAQISEDSYKIHLRPMAQMFTDGVTLGVLWPQMAARLGISAEQAAEANYPPEMLQLVVIPDASELVAHPDKVKDLLDTFVKDPTQMSIKIAEVRESLELDPSNPPDDEEVAKRVDAIRLTKIREVINASPEDAAVAIDQAGKAVIPGASEGQQTIEEGAKAVVPTKADNEAGALAGSALLAAQIAAAADLMLERCAGKVGAKLKVRASAEQRQSIGNLSDYEVAAALGPTETQRLLNGDDPTRGELAALERVVSSWAAATGRRDGGALAKAVGTVMEAAISERLYGSGRPEVNHDVFATLADLAPSGLS